MSRHPLHSVYLRRRRKIVLAEGTDRLPVTYVATLLKNLERLGCTCSPRLLARLQTLSERELAITYGALVAGLRELKGAHVAWEPMYPNFPQQVMDASDAELYLNALMHYLGDWVGARILPIHAVTDRPPLVEAVKLEVIDLGDVDELATIARDLIAANTSISQQDKEDVAAIVAYFTADIARVLPTEIPNKENLAFTTSLLLEHRVASDVLLTRYFKTATDVLRLAAALSGGDVSLAKPAKLRSFKRPERRLLLSLVERVASPDEDMWRFREPWLRLGERLHPGELAKAYPKTAAAFARLRAGDRPSTFASQVEGALRERQVGFALDKLKTRPGELARRLDHLLRTGPAFASSVIDEFRACAERVSTPVLLQVMTHFEHRKLHESVRPVFPKGNAAKVMAVPNELPQLPERVCAHVVAACEAALVARFAKLAPLGKVYVDPRLRDYIVPFSQRSASKALRTLVRGSRVPLPPGGTLRFFLWWKEGKIDGKPTGRVDIDLSAIFYSAKFGYLEHVSWTNLRSSKYRSWHSGDITSAPDGACEFIDLELESMRAAKVRYVVASVYAFTSHPFCNLPECFTGWMMRSEPNSGEIFEPATVVDRVDLAADGRVAVPAIFDLETRQVIWTDVAYQTSPRAVAAVETRQSSLVQLVQAMHALHKTSLYRLFELHGRARGKLVASESQAETVFSVERGVTPFDHEAIMARFLG